MRRGIALAIALVLSSCAPISHSQTALQRLNVVLQAGPGDVVARVDKSRNLENVFGRADVYGRRTNEGYAELRFVGVEADGTVVLYRKDLMIVSNETTLTRTPVAQTFTQQTTTANANVFGNSVAGTSNTFGSSTTIAPAMDFHVAIPSDAIPIRLPKNIRSLPFEGHTVSIIDASPAGLSYRVSDATTAQ